MFVIHAGKILNQVQNDNLGVQDGRRGWQDVFCVFPMRDGGAKGQHAMEIRHL